MGPCQPFARRQVPCSSRSVWRSLKNTYGEGEIKAQSPTFRGGSDPQPSLRLINLKFWSEQESDVRSPVNLIWFRILFLPLPVTMYRVYPMYQIREPKLRGTCKKKQ